MNIIYENLIGFFIGLAASYAVWFGIQNYLVPTVKFSEELNKYELPSGEHIYRVKIQNVGKSTIIDIEIIVRIGIKEFMGAHGWAYHSIRTNISRYPSLKKGGKILIRVFDPRDPIEFIDVPSIPIRKAITNIKHLEEVSLLGSDANISIHLFGYDARSGVRQHFSKSYDKKSIRKGTYNDELDIVSNEKIFSYRAAVKI